MKLTFHHLNLNTHDVPELDRFYGEVMLQDDVPSMRDVPSVSEGIYPGALAFRTDGQLQFHLTETDTGVGIRAGKAINPMERGHIAFRTDDMEAFKRHLTEKGIAFVDYGTTFTKRWTQIYFHDPAGNVIEVHQVLEGDD
ncbi:MAG: VOC family protein [Pseudomonadota bacterium]